MNQTLVDQIADAVLYEGYILYPYRPALKNRQRWTFGGLYPAAYVAAHPGSDAQELQTQCLLRGPRSARLEVHARFLHLTDRVAGELLAPGASLAPDAEPAFRPVPALEIDGRQHHSWQEAVERRVELPVFDPQSLLSAPQSHPFAFDADHRLELLRGASGEPAGVLARERRPLRGVVELSAEELADDLFRLTVRVRNESALEDADRASRDEALLRSLVSTHAVLGARGGEFVSLTDPPAELRGAASACVNRGAWPVLVGEEGARDTLLASPIILSDYPEIASESPGEFFDSAEIDEMLTLRILTLTNDEQAEMAALDPRARALLERSQALARDQLLNLHGAIRAPRPRGREQYHD
jgi:hydrogenase maturation protease